MSKYKNKHIEYLGAVFDSRAEKERYVELLLLQKAGKVSNLRRQVKYELLPAAYGEQAVTYKADFVYETGGKTIVEDYKGFQTAVYKIKRKLFKQKYPELIFSEVTKGEFTRPVPILGNLT